MLDKCSEYASGNVYTMGRNPTLQNAEISFYRNCLEEACRNLPSPEEKYNAIKAVIKYLYALETLDTTESKTSFSHLLSTFYTPSKLDYRVSSKLDYFSEMFSKNFKESILHTNDDKFDEIIFSLNEIKSTYDLKTKGPLSLFQAHKELQTEKSEFIAFLVHTLNEIRTSPTNTKIPNGIRTMYDFIEEMILHWCGSKHRAGSLQETDGSNLERKRALDRHDQRGFGTALKNFSETIQLDIRWAEAHVINFSAGAAISATSTSMIYSPQPADAYSQRARPDQRMTEEHSSQSFFSATAPKQAFNDAEPDAWTVACEQPLRSLSPTPASNETAKVESNDDANRTSRNYSR